MLKLTLPFPPSANHLHTVCRGRKILSSKGRKYYETVAWKVKQALGVFTPLQGRICLSITVNAPDRRRRDLSNLVKALEDALTKSLVWVDDSQIDTLHVLRGTVIKDGNVMVEILENEPAK